MLAYLFRNLLSFTIVPYVIGAFWSIPMLFGMVMKVLTHGPSYFQRKHRDNTTLPVVLRSDEFEHNTFKLDNGIKLHTVTMAPQDDQRKPLMLFLHGFPESWYAWRHQLLEYGRIDSDYHAVAFDMRGYGFSDKPTECSAYGISCLVEDVKLLIRALGYEKAIIVAHDWGGIVAWNFAHLHQDMVEKLIVMNCPHPILYRKSISWKQFLSSWYIFFFMMPILPELMLVANDFEFLRKAFLGRNMGIVDRSHFSDDDLEASIWMFSRPGVVTSALNYYRNLFSRPPVLKTKVLTVPTLLLWGMKDRALTFEINHGIEKIVPSIHIVPIENSSHWINQDAVHDVKREMKAFLSQNKEENS